MEARKQNIDAIAADGAGAFQGHQQFSPNETDVVIFDFSSEIESMRRQLAAEREARLRLAAEYDNYRRRTKRESGNAADEGKREVIEQMLPIADELDLAVSNLSGELHWVAEWVQAHHRRFH